MELTIQVPKNPILIEFHKDSKYYLFLLKNKY